MRKSSYRFTVPLVACMLGICLFSFLALPAAVEAASMLRPLADTITVGGACGATIQECISSANAGDTVLIPAGEYEESLLLTKAVSLVGADRETTIVRAASQQRALTISGVDVNASVVISGLTFTKAEVDESCPAGSACGGILVNGEAQPSLVNLIIAANNHSSGAGLYTEPGSPLILVDVRFIGNSGRAAYLQDSATIQDSYFEGNTGSDGGALCICVAATLVMTNTDFVNNVSTGLGGAVFAYNTELYGGSFVDNQSGNSGGALFISGILNAQDVEFMGNSSGAGGYGGAAYVNPPNFISVSTVSDSHFENNRVLDGSGGGIYVAGNLRLTNTDFISNTSQYAGGGAHVYFSSKATVTGGRFERNSATDGDGGGLYAGEADIDGTVFISNSAALYGGGASIVYGAQVRNARFEENEANKFHFGTAAGGGGLVVFASNGTGDVIAITDTVFLKNRAVGGGGALAASMLTMHGVRFEQNDSETFGGAWYAFAQGGAVPSADDVEFIDNTAPLGGGAHLRVANAELSNCLFDGNQALNGDGGGLQLYENKTVIAHCRFLGNMASAGGGGLHSQLSQFQLYDSSFESNHATMDGGAINGYNFTITTTAFLDNSANGNGGAIFGSDLSVSRSRFVGNQASLGGGIYALGGGNLSEAYIDNSLFAHNMATDWGAAALHLVGGSPFLNYLTIADHTPNPNAAIYTVGACGNVSGCTRAVVNNSILANHAVGIWHDEPGGAGRAD